MAPFGATLGSLVSLWGDFGISFALLGVTLGWDAFGSLWAAFGYLVPPFQKMVEN